jgi:hypothetical protein
VPRKPHVNCTFLAKRRRVYQPHYSTAVSDLCEHERAQDQLFLDLFAEDSWRRVHAGEREVRPPGAPTTPATGDLGRS